MKNVTNTSYDGNQLQNIGKFFQKLVWNHLYSSNWCKSAKVPSCILSKLLNFLSIRVKCPKAFCTSLFHSSGAQRNGDLISGWYEETGWWHINCSEHCSGRRLYLKRSHTPDNELQNSKNRLKHNTSMDKSGSILYSIIYSVECPAQQLSALPASTVHSSAVQWVAECKSLGGCETRNWPQFQSKSCQHQIAWNTPPLWPSGWGKWWLLTFAMLRRQRWWRWGYIWQ